MTRFTENESVYDMIFQGLSINQSVYVGSLCQQMWLIQSRIRIRKNRFRIQRLTGSVFFDVDPLAAIF